MLNISDIFSSLYPRFKFELQQAAYQPPGALRGDFDEMFSSPQGRDLISDLHMCVNFAFDACLKKGKPTVSASAEWRLSRLIRNSITLERRKALKDLNNNGTGASDLRAMLTHIESVTDHEERLMAVITQSVQNFGLQRMIERFSKHIAVLDYALRFFSMFAGEMLRQTKLYYDDKAGFKPAWVTDKQKYDREFALYQDARHYLSEYVAIVLTLLNDIVNEIPTECGEDDSTWSVEFCAAKPMAEKISDMLYQNGISLAVHSRYAMIKNDILLYKA
jgi:hypothetical protein